MELSFYILGMQHAMEPGMMNAQCVCTPSFDDYDEYVRGYEDGKYY